jgi:hypothetical protein
MMNNRTSIRYRGLHDVPRIMLVDHKNKLFLLSCPFNEELDEYPDTYKVYLLPPLTDQELGGNWEELYLKATQYLGEVPVGDVQFDPSRRHGIDAAVLDTLLSASSSKQG